MSGPHLGDRLSAFVDGELDHGARDRATAHLAHCGPCRAEVEAERAVKARLSRLDGPVPPSHVVDRLVGLPAVEEAAIPRRPGEPPALKRSATVGPVPGRPRGRRDRTARPHRDRDRTPRSARSLTRRRRLLAGTGGALVVAALGTAFAVGGGPAGGRPVTPEVDRFTVEHAAVTDAVPLTDVGSAATVSVLDPAAP